MNICENTVFYETAIRLFLKITRALIVCCIFIEDFTLLGDLLSQLKWLIANVCYGDANLLLAQYRDYKSKVPQTVSF